MKKQEILALANTIKEKWIAAGNPKVGAEKAQEFIDEHMKDCEDDFKTIIMNMRQTINLLLKQIDQLTDYEYKSND